MSVGGHDLPEEASSVAALRAEIERLKNEVQVRDNLLAVAAHELRNPMHAMLLQVTAALALARKQQAPEELIRRLDRIRHIVETYIKRATLLLDAMRIDARGWQVERTKSDFAEIVDEITRSFEPEAQFASCELVTVLPQNLEGRWDRLAAEQIVANLVSNAIKYGAGSRVEVRLTQTAPGVAKLQVSDRGPGIAAQDLKRIFERFQRAVEPGQRRSGFGIGLWLVRSLVEAHGGTIEVDSKPGQGSTFTAHLPSESGSASSSS